MYYFNCICSCTEIDDDASICHLRNYSNYLSLMNDEEAKLLILCLALSPDKLISSIFLFLIKTVTVELILRIECSQYKAIGF